MVMDKRFGTMDGRFDGVRKIYIGVSVSSRTWSLIGCCSGGVLIRVHVLRMESNV